MTRKIPTKIAYAIAALVIAGSGLLALGSGARSADPEPPATTTPTETPQTETPQHATHTAAALLDTLEIKGRAPKTGYDRKEQFGSPWTDVDHNGCDTRNDILARDLGEVTRDDNCRVLTGVLEDPFTGETVGFVRGQATSSIVQIDHLVPLSDAWQKGAQQLTHEERIDLANDPLNLQAVLGSANAQKSDGDAATWLPPNKSFRCEYVARQISVKAKYSLWVTQTEKEAMSRVLTACPDQRAYTTGP